MRKSLGLTGYTSKTSRLSSAAERPLRQADKALSGSASNIENIELQDLFGVVNSALRSTEQAETALDEEQSKALTSVNDQPLDTAWVSPTARELAGLKKAMTGMRDEMVNNLAKLPEVDERKSEVEKHLAQEHKKLAYEWPWNSARDTRSNQESWARALRHKNRKRVTARSPLSK